MQNHNTTLIGKNMRIHGNIIRWNDERGFGFIALPQSDDEIFFHISAFPKHGGRPKIGELISFKIQIENNGKKQAVRIERPGSQKDKRNSISHKESPLITTLFVIIVSTLGYFGYKTFSSQESTDMELQFFSKKPNDNTGTLNNQFKCDGRQHCSQMRSRAEAEFFVRNCPNTKMDGDNDGIPCENDSRF